MSPKPSERDRSSSSVQVAERTLASAQVRVTFGPVVLGFAGAISALSARPVGPWSGAGLVAATASGLLALTAFWPRKYWRTDLDALRRKYLAADPVFARIGLLDSQILMATRQYGALRWKVLFLKLAMLSLAMAVPLSALGTTLE